MSFVMSRKRRRRGARVGGLPRGPGSADHRQQTGQKEEEEDEDEEEAEQEGEAEAGTMVVGVQTGH